MGFETWLSLGRCHTFRIVLFGILIYGTLAELSRDEIQSPPSFFKEPPSEGIRFQVATKEGKEEGTETLVLECEATGNPHPTYKWFKNGQQFDYESKPRWTLRNRYKGTLVVSHPTPRDEGVYHCEATNKYGTSVSNSASVKKFGAPRWITVPNDTNVDRYEDVRFECVASGDPQPSVEWLVNGVKLSLAAANPRRKLVSPTVLTIKDLDFTDTAVYQCRASSSAGLILRNFYLNVLYIIPIITEPPKELYEVMQGTAVTLRCRFVAFPSAYVKWTRDGSKLEGKRFTVEPNGDLHISNVLDTDEGQYTCIVANLIGEYVSGNSDGHLVVREKTRITTPPEDIEVTAGDNAVFLCEVASDDNLTTVVEWYFNGAKIDTRSDSGKTFMKVDRSLAVFWTTDADSGVYKCIAKTRMDNVTAQATLTVHDVPKPPIFTSVTCNIDKRSAVLKWQPNGTILAGNPIRSYRIEYNISLGYYDWRTVEAEVIPTPDLTYEVSLKPAIGYTFGITAYNKVGTSERSVNFTLCRTPPDVPYSNPTQVRSRETYADKLHISWQRMLEEEDNGPGLFYRVHWKRAGNETEWQVKDVLDNRETELIVEDQPTYVQYDIKVEAHNKLGQANVAAEVVTGHSGEDKPLLSPQNLRLVSVVDHNTAIITWDPVPPESVRGYFKGYKMETYSKKEGLKNIKESVVKGTVSEYSLGILTPYTDNFVRVRVVNSNYEGPPSNIIIITTPEGIPGTVASFQAYQMGSKALWLTWSKPNEINGNLMGYRIFYQKVENTRLNEMVERKSPINNPESTSAKLDGLQPNTRYRIAIRAVTGAGLGTPYFVEDRTASDTPKPPRKPSFSWKRMENSGTTIVVTWIPNLDTNPGSHFYVQYRLKGKTQWQKADDVLNDDNDVIEGLVSGIYEMKVVAVDGEYEESSDVVEINTIETDKLEPTSPWTRVESNNGNVDLRISWNSHTKHDVEGSYNVKYSEKKRLWKTINDVPFNKSVTIKGLSRETEYLLDVTQINWNPNDWH